MQYFIPPHVMIVFKLISLLDLNFKCLMKIFAVTSKAFLADDNLGDSLDGVEALIRKHEDFDKSFAAQAEKINVSEVLIPQCT